MSDRRVSGISLEDIVDLLLQGRVSVVSSVQESVVHSLLSPSVGFLVVSVLSVLVLEDLLLNDVIEAFMRIVGVSVVLEIEPSWIELACRSQV